MLLDEIKISGAVQLVLKDEFGNVKEDRTIKNLVVTTGRNYIASRIKDATATVMSHFAVGTSSTTPALGDITLGTESGRVALSATTVSTNVVTYTATVPAGTATAALVEAGIFNASSAGDMLCRTTFAVINKGANDSLTATWTLTVS